MELVNVESSNILSIGWQDDVLRIVFLNGRVYDYVKVPKHVYEYFLESESKGKYFHSKINDKYTYVRVDNLEK